MVAFRTPAVPRVCRTHALLRDVAAAFRHRTTTLPRNCVYSRTTAHTSQLSIVYAALRIRLRIHFIYVLDGTTPVRVLVGYRRLTARQNFHAHRATQHSCPLLYFSLHRNTTYPPTYRTPPLSVTHPFFPHVATAPHWFYQARLPLCTTLTFSLHASCIACPPPSSQTAGIWHAAAFCAHAAHAPLQARCLLGYTPRATRRLNTCRRT